MASRSAKNRVNIGAMCGTTISGARKSAGSFDRISPSAAGPPVERLIATMSALIIAPSGRSVKPGVERAPRLVRRRTRQSARQPAQRLDLGNQIFADALLRGLLPAAPAGLVT